MQIKIKIKEHVYTVKIFNLEKNIVEIKEIKTGRKIRGENIVRTLEKEFGEKTEKFLSLKNEAVETSVYVIEKEELLKHSEKL